MGVNVGRLCLDTSVSVQCTGPRAHCRSDRRRMLVCSYIHVALAKASEIIGRHRFKCLVQVSADAKTHKRSLWHILARYANQGRLLPQTFAVEFGKHTNTHDSGKHGNSWQWPLHCPGNSWMHQYGCRWPQTMVATSSTNKQTFAANTQNKQTQQLLSSLPPGTVGCTGCRQPHLAMGLASDALLAPN